MSSVHTSFIIPINVGISSTLKLRFCFCFVCIFNAKDYKSLAVNSLRSSYPRKFLEFHSPENCRHAAGISVPERDGQLGCLPRLSLIN